MPRATTFARDSCPTRYTEQSGQALPGRPEKRARAHPDTWEVKAHSTRLHLAALQKYSYCGPTFPCKHSDLRVRTIFKNLEDLHVEADENVKHVGYRSSILTWILLIRAQQNLVYYTINAKHAATCLIIAE